MSALVPARPHLAVQAPPVHPEDAVRAGMATQIGRHRLVFAAAFVLTASLVFAGYLVAPRSYLGHASIVLASPEALLGGGDAALEQKQGDPADVESQAALLASFGLLQRVAAQPSIATLLAQGCRTEAGSPMHRLALLVSGPMNCAALLRDPVAGARALQGQVGISTDGRSRVIDLNYASPVPAAARIVPNAIVDGYIEDRLHEKLDSRSAAVAWLRGQTDRIAADLAHTEAEIDSFRGQHGLVRGQVASLASEQLTAITQALAAAQAAQSEAAAKAGAQAGGTGDTHDVLTNLAIDNLKQQIATVAAEAGALSASYGPSHPKVLELRSRQAALSARLAAETARIGSSMRQDLAAANARVYALQAQLEEAKSRVADGVNAETQIASLQRHADVQRELYLDLSKKINAIEAERRTVTGSARVVSYAQLPTQVSFPRKLPFLLGGFVLAACAGLGAALVADRSDRTVRTKLGLRLASGLPVLGYIPKLRHAGRIAHTRSDAVSEPYQKPALQDAIRHLYAQTVLVQARAPRSILVTSAQSGDGKTFITLALARFAAESGKRVLAVECDLRRPDFAAALGINGDTGLVDHLRGGAPHEAIVRADVAPGLDVIAAGKPTFASTELLSNGRILELLAWARTRYDLVLVDSPPSEALMDAHLLADAVDSILFCVCWGKSRTEHVLEAVEQIAGHGAKSIGFAINRTDTARLSQYDAGYGKRTSYGPRLA